MTAWETEDEYAAAACTSLPSPVDTPRSNRSRSRQNRISIAPLHSPPITGYNRLSRSNEINLPEGFSFPKRSSSSSITPHGISMLDPHRFTPTLHASLVSEIIGLRRDQEEKKNLIESLEVTLLESREEQESISAELSSATQLNNSLKRKLELLEGGTSSALSKLAKERDIAIESVSEIKGRLVAAQKKIRSQEEEHDRSHVLWTREKTTLEDQRRSLERRVHIAESRLKKVLEEVAEYEARQNEKNEEGFKKEAHLSHCQGPNISHIRRESSANSFILPPSHDSNLAVLPTTGGLSLADELDSCYEDEANDFVDWESVSSLPSLDQIRPSSRNSSVNDTFSSSATTQPRTSSTTQERTLMKRTEDQGSEDNPQNPISFNPLLLKMHSTQCTVDIEPPSETKSPQATSSEALDEESDDQSHAKNYSVSSKTCPMVSVASQTQGKVEPQMTSEVQLKRSIKVKSSATQTEPPRPKAIPSPIVIPSIKLHPPSSAPASPHQQMLPRQFKHASCQAQIPLSVNSKSSSVQTEEIRIDKRIYALPPNLRPSAISSSPPSPVVDNPSRPSSRQNPQNKPSQIVSNSSLENYRDEHLGRRISCVKFPLSEGQTSKSENGISDDDENADDLSDSGYKTQLYTAKYHKRSSFEHKPTPNGISAVPKMKIAPPEEVICTSNDMPHFSMMSKNLPLRNFENSLTITSQVLDAQESTPKSPLNTQSDHSHSPSSSEKSPEPPFPIPLRRSSRRVTPGSSALDDGVESPVNQGKRAYRRPGGVKRIRPNVAFTKLSTNTTQRHDFRTPQRSVSDLNQQSTTPPPVPEHEFSFRHKRQNLQIEVHSPNSDTFNHMPDSGSDSTTSVVGAIAQTMVGEWMFKYVRRRKSIGVAESALDTENSNGVRHKRWVWLAPYERLVMWSTKQPISGSALMGKSGRKLSIQSVLDVKDDNAPPKGIHLFNRSILILTPTRALKFTATTMERHYIWLTALSFLAHSPQAIPESISSSIAHNQFKPQSIFEASPSPRRRQFGVRQDSIRLAKSKLALASNSALNPAQSTSDLPTESLYSFQSSAQAAYAPIVPRFTNRSASQFALTKNPNSHTSLHQRKRSNTVSRYPSHVSIFGDRSGTLLSPTFVKNNAYYNAVSPTESQSHRETSHFFLHSSAQNSKILLPSSKPVEHDIFNRSKFEILDNSGTGTGTVRMEAFVSSPDSYKEEPECEINCSWENNGIVKESFKLSEKELREANPNNHNFDHFKLTATKPDTTNFKNESRSMTGSCEDNWDTFRGF